MKKLFTLCASIVAMANAQAPVDSIRTVATTSWQKIEYATQAVRAGYIINEGTNAGDSIAYSVCVTADTAANVRGKLLGGETVSFSNKQMKALWYRSLTGSPINARICVTNAPVTISNNRSTSIPVTVQQTPITSLAPAGVTIDTTSVLIVAANANRKGLVITNLSNTTVYLAFNTAAIKEKGVTLFAGGIFNMNAYMFSLTAIYAIANNLSTKIAIQEWQ